MYALKMTDTFDDYQFWATQTRVGDFSGLPPIVYCTMKLSGESGEFCEKVAKAYRDNGGNLTKEMTQALIYELGDVLWYMANCADLLGYNLSQVADLNNKKIKDRIERGVLKGSGDNR